MPLGDFFRGLLGVPRPRTDENNNRDIWANDVFHDFFRDFSNLIEDHRDMDGGESSLHSPEEDGDYNSTQNDFGFSLFHAEPHDMMRHFEHQFMRTFQQFGFIDIPQLAPGIGGSQFFSDEDVATGDGGAGGLLRPGGRFRVPHHDSHELDSGEHDGGASIQGSSLRDRLLKKHSPSPAVPHARVDSDLDQSVTDGGGLSAIFDMPGNTDAASWSSAPRHGSSQRHFSYSSSVSVQTVRRADGSVEERRVVCKPDGTCETSTRVLHASDQHSVQPGSIRDSGSGLLKAGDENERGGRVDSGFWRSLFGM